MNIKLTDIPIRSQNTVSIEMENQMLSLDFRRKNRVLGAYIEFRVNGAKLSIIVDAATSDSPRQFEIDLSGAGRVKKEITR